MNIEKPRKYVRKKAVDPYRGELSRIIHGMRLGQIIHCPPGIPRYPHQSVYYYNMCARKNGDPRRWSAEYVRDEKGGVEEWQITRVL